MKKVLSLTLIFLLLLSSVPTFAFNDVSKKDWHETYVTKAVELKLVNGYKDGSFKPQNNVTVAEFISMTLNAIYSKYPAPENLKDNIKKWQSTSKSNSSSGTSSSVSIGSSSSTGSSSTSSGVSIGGTIGGSIGVPGIGSISAGQSAGQSTSSGSNLGGSIGVPGIGGVNGGQSSGQSTSNIYEKKLRVMKP